MEIKEAKEGDKCWAAAWSHLQRTHDLKWVTESGEGEKIRPGINMLVAITEAGRVVGHISFKRRPLALTDERKTPLRLDGEQLWETYVQTFSVEEDFRRRGLGSALQRAALKKSAELGCHQMRSWSSRDKGGNYQLKLKLGFSLVPAVIKPDSKETVYGGYFVKSLRKQNKQD